MSEWHDHGIILRMGLFHESDYWLKILFKQNGLATVFAFGGAKSLHRFCGCLDLLNILDCKVKISSDGKFINLQEARLVSAPHRLRSDWRRMGIMANCMRFMEIAGEDFNESAIFYDLLLNLRETLESSPIISNLTPIFFRFAVASAAGYAVNIQNCGNCGNHLDHSANFLISEGKFLCPACENKFRKVISGLHITPPVLKMLQLVQFKMPQEWPRQMLDRSTTFLCSLVVEKFINWHMGITYSDTGFKKLAGNPAQRMIASQGNLS